VQKAEELAEQEWENNNEDVLEANVWVFKYII